MGAGQVGSTLAESLVSEQNDITVVDIDPRRLKDLQDRLDLRTVVGFAAHPSTLIEAGIEDTDLLIAVTQSDETNLAACKVGKMLFNVPTRIARVRSRSILARPELLTDEGFAVDYAISPEDIVTEAISRLIEFPEALQVLDFAGGRVTMVAVRAVEGGPLVGLPLKDMRKHLTNVDARVTAIFRGDQAIIPDGDTVVKAGDEVFCIADTEHIRQVMRELRKMDKPVKRLMIAGGRQHRAAPRPGAGEGVSGQDHRVQQGPRGAHRRPPQLGARPAGRRDRRGAAREREHRRDGPLPRRSRTMTRTTS